MDYDPITPFGRSLRRAQSLAAAPQETQAPCPTVDKWQALRALSTCRSDYALSDRDLAVLQALISFHPRTELALDDGPLVVHPSNASICERLNGMPSSTMRRHLGRLVDAGIITRRDSPNGKRYARRFGGTKVAYGFDLAPLARRFAEFEDAAQAQRDRDLRIRHLRDVVSLMRRDLEALTEIGRTEAPSAPFWDAYEDLARLTARTLRRKLAENQLSELRDTLASAVEAAKAMVIPAETVELSSSDVRNEQHHQSSEKDSIESEQAKRESVPDAAFPPPQLVRSQMASEHTISTARPSNLPLAFVLASCPEFCSFQPDPIRSWPQFFDAADRLVPMLGIQSTTWQDVKRDMGRDQAAVVIAAMLERLSEIRSPGAYLRDLGKRAAAGTFSCAPMVVALSRRSAA